MEIKLKSFGIFFLLLTSCSSIRTKKEGFIYDKPIVHAGSDLRLNKAYIKDYKEYDLYQLLVFNKRGQYIYLKLVDLTCPLNIKQYKIPNVYEYGLYEIRDDTLITQSWYGNPQDFFYRRIEERKALIKDDVLVFEPDSTDQSTPPSDYVVSKRLNCDLEGLFEKYPAWYEKKSWYKRNLHPSRK